MSVYNQDKFTLLEIKYEDEVIYKVFGSWAGGYLGSDSWRMNSGIERAVCDSETISFIGSSGSTYKCNLLSEGVTGAYNMGTLNSLLDNYPDSVRIVSLEECLEGKFFEVVVSGDRHE